MPSAAPAPPVTPPPSLHDALPISDSRGPGEPKDPENAHLYAIFKAFATPEQSQEFAQELRDGLSWGAAKDRLFELVNGEIAPMRERYHELIARPQIIEIGRASCRGMGENCEC